MSTIREIANYQILCSELSIDNFRTINKVVGHDITSRFILKVGDKNLEFKWRLYPNGKSVSDQNWLSAYVYIISSNGVMTVATSITILDNKNNIIKCKVIPKRDYDTDKGDESWFGFSQFVERDFVINEANGVLHDNKLRLQCKIKIYYNTTISPNDGNVEQASVKTDSILDNTCRLAEFDEFESLIGEQQFSDISIIIEGKTVRAHKCILAKRSSVFAAMFQHEMKESLENKVEIEDIKHDIFVELLRFIYAGKVNSIENIARELLEVAEKYSISGLKIECGKALIKHLSIDNVIQNLQLADKYNMDRLKVDAIDFIVANQIDFVQNPELELLMQMPKVIFGLCKTAMMHCIQIQNDNF